jgi:hypothetical protein
VCLHSTTVRKIVAIETQLVHNSCIGRKRVIRHLPPLAEVAGSPEPFSPQDNHAQVLADRLRIIAGLLRRNDWHPFYAMREVARYFQISVPTVARSYKLLENDGLLVRVRSAHTLLRPANVRARRPVHAIVAVPVWTPSLATFSEWQEFYTCFQETLHEHEIAADFLFYQMGNLTSVDLAERIIAHHPNMLFWLEPDKCFRETMQMAADQGVQVSTLTYQMAEFPGCQYRVSWRRALGTLFQNWKEHGIRSIVMAGDTNPATAAIDRQILAEVGLKYSFHDLSRQPLAQWIAALPDPHSVGVILNHSPEFARLLILSPNELPLLFRTMRVMVSPRMSIASSVLGDARIDVVSFDWTAIARRIAQDLISAKTPRAASRLFEAEIQFRIPASQRTIINSPYI